MKDLGALWVTAADSYILECRAIATSVRASEFASRMNRSPVQWAREFHTSVGSTVKDYFSARQIEHAKELLRDTARSTAQIAVAAGFWDCALLLPRVPAADRSLSYGLPEKNVTWRYRRPALDFRSQQYKSSIPPVAGGL